MPIIILSAGSDSFLTDYVGLLFIYNGPKISINTIEYPPPHLPQETNRPQSKLQQQTRALAVVGLLLSSNSEIEYSFEFLIDNNRGEKIKDLNIWFDEKLSFE